MLVGKIRDTQIRVTHLDGLTYPEKHCNSNVWSRFGEMGREFTLITW